MRKRPRWIIKGHRHIVNGLQGIGLLAIITAIQCIGKSLFISLYDGPECLESLPIVISRYDFLPWVYPLNALHASSCFRRENGLSVSTYKRSGS